MVTATTIKKGYKQTEIGVIPEDWDILRLNETSKVIDSLHQTPNFVEDGFAMVRVADIKSGTLNLEGALRVDEKVFQEYIKNYQPKQGDIVLSRVGSYGISSFVSTNELFCMGQNTVVIVPNVDNKYLYYVLNSTIIRKQIEDGSFGSGYKSLSLKNIKELKLQLPKSKPEQNAIATVLSDTDVLIEHLKKLIAKKKAIKQGAMQQLLTGKKRLPGFSCEWDVKELGEIGEISGAGIDKKIKPDQLSVRLVNYLDVYHRNFIYSRDLNHWVTAPVAQFQRCLVRKGDIFFTPSSEMPFDIGISSVAMEDIDDAGYSYHVVRLRLKEDWDIKFRAYIFKTRFFLSQAERFCEGSGQRYVISLARFRKLSVKFPIEISEQTAIAQVFSDMDSEIESLEQKQDKYTMLKQGMMQELLTGKTRLI